MTPATGTLIVRSWPKYMRRLNASLWRPLSANIHTSCRCLKKQPPPEDFDKPIQFTKSKAHDWRAIDTFTTPVDNHPPYQPMVLVTSFAIFLIYFLVLREENDIDETMSTSLYERIPGLEEQNLLARIDYDKKQGNDVTALESRLKEVREKEKARVSSDT